jgi:glyoxylase-like metal-dependent hydrolase (beta-lactamase superfamily II)
VTHVEPRRIGSVEFRVACQGWAPLELADECPGEQVDWTGERRRFPWAFAETQHWRWHVHAIAVRMPWGVAMVDTGLGTHPPVDPWADGEGVAASDAYARADVDPAEVSLVVLTHMHPDHVGGVLEGGEPRFSNARHVLHEADRAYAERPDLSRYTVRSRPDLRRLEELGMLELDPDDREVAPGIRVIHAPGHTPGHRSVIVETDDGDVLVTGDLLHMPVQIAHPAWRSDHDVDPEEAARSRVSLVGRALDEAWTVAVHHFARPWGRVTTEGWTSLTE